MHISTAQVPHPAPSAPIALAAAPGGGCATSTRSKRPATSLAREAIEAWVAERERQAVHEAIATYATEMAGTSADLDAGIELAAIEHLRGRRRKR